jgi:hypothetical protein
MVDNVIGFAGCDNYELILYLSRILYHLGKRVLLIDYSETEALYQCIPIPESLRGSNCCINYRGVDFIQGHFFLPEMSSQYDIIFMDLGFQMHEIIIPKCTKLFYVTDLQLQNINRIKNLKYPENVDKYLIIKDVFQCKIKPEYIISQLGTVIDQKKVYILFQDALDQKYKVQSQYNYFFRFDKLSGSVSYFLKDSIRQLDNRHNEKDINYAYKKAGRGK